MIFIQNNITSVIAFLTLLSHVVFVLVLVLVAFSGEVRLTVYNFIDKNILNLLFLFSLAALVGSLAYSNIIGFPPCELCWIQRIFMYPQVLLSGVALWRKDKNIVTYLLSLSVLGGIVALYHSL